MNTDELREKYLEFFQSKDHRRVASDVLVPTWDPTVLFTPAGMNQFKDHFLGKVQLEFTRATTCQKCLRTGDIENVGRTAYHHTFFEMLGNFSFGDYFKRDAIQWAWEFLTDRRWLGIDPDRLTVTVYQDDHEAAEIWMKDVGLPENRVGWLDEYENFWPAGAPTDGPDGVCGPCSEIFFHPDSGKEVEIWNLVFTQFNRVGDPPENLSPLPSKNIDTGMGLERTAATLQGVETNFHIDILKPIVLAAAEVCRMNYDADSDDGRKLRRITDHIRACTFAIHENVYPGPNKEQYVVKRLLRRAVLDGHQMGLREPFLFQLVPTIAEIMKSPYPELTETAERVAAVVKAEESNFLDTIDDGLDRIEKIFGSMRQSGLRAVDGSNAAELYQTYGVPPELFEQMAIEHDFTFDWDGFDQAMEKHGKESGKISTGVMADFGPVDEIKRQLKSTEFLGYDQTTATATVRGLIAGDTLAQSLAAKQSDENIVVLDRSPFYAESGGQVGDTGTISTNDAEFAVTDTQRSGDVILHLGRMIQGTIKIGDEVNAVVDSTRRDAIRRAHSATHLLHYALQQNLGSHAQQRGSKVTDDWLRFDFTNLSGIDGETLDSIEQQSNDFIQNGAPIHAEILPLSVAKEQGAMMLFGEKYPDPVRMISIGDFSKELCGGTHLSNSSEIGSIEIISEEAVSSGTRRIVALTGEKANAHSQQTREILGILSTLLKVPESDVPAVVQRLIGRAKDLKKHLSTGKQISGDQTRQEHTNGSSDLSYQHVRSLVQKTARMLNVPINETPGRVEALINEVTDLEQQIKQQSDTESISADTLIRRATLVGDIQLIVEEVPGANPNMMRGLIDQIRKTTQPTAIFLASIQSADKVLLVAGLSKDLVKKGFSAGDWVKEVAPTVGGGGGGKPDLAQAGGRQPEKINVALDAAREFMRSSTVT